MIASKNVVSGNGSTGGILRCHTSGPGMRSKNGFVMYAACLPPVAESLICAGLVHDSRVPRPAGCAASAGGGGADIVGKLVPGPPAARVPAAVPVSHVSPVTPTRRTQAHANSPNRAAPAAWPPFAALLRCSAIHTPVCTAKS